MKCVIGHPVLRRREQSSSAHKAQVENATQLRNECYTNLKFGGNTVHRGSYKLLTLKVKNSKFKFTAHILRLIDQSSRSPDRKSSCVKSDILSHGWTCDLQTGKINQSIN